MSIDEIKKNATGVKYDDLFRNNENHMGKIVYYRGEIFQVSEINPNNYILMVSVTLDDYFWTYFWTDNIYV